MFAVASANRLGPSQGMNGFGAHANKRNIGVVLNMIPVDDDQFKRNMQKYEAEA